MQQEKENLKKIKNDMHALKVVHGKSSIKGVTEILKNPMNGQSNGDEQKKGFQEKERPSKSQEADVRKQ